MKFSSLYVRESSLRPLQSGIVCAGLLAAFTFQNAGAQVAPSLGTAQSYSILAGSTITNTGPTVMAGNVGVSPGTAITGLPPQNSRTVTLQSGTAAAANAESAAAAAFKNLSTQTCGTAFSVPTDIGGMTLTPGVYCFASSTQITGTLTLDAGGDPNAVWIFQTAETLITANDSFVQLANSAQKSNVFWQVGSSATLGTGSTFVGNILALASITLTTDANLSGRAFALNGAVTLDTNTVSFCVCLQPYAAIASTVSNTLTVAPSVGGTPGNVFGASLSPDGKSVWVAGSNGNTTPGFISLIDVASSTVTNSFPVGKGPSDIAFSTPGGRAFVTNFSDSSLSIISVPKLKVTQTLDMSGLPLTNPFGIVRASGRIFVTTQGIASQGANNVVPDMALSTPVTFNNSVSMPGQSGRPAVVPSGSSRYHGSVLVPVFVTGGGHGSGHPALVVMNVAHDTTPTRITLWSSTAIPEAVVVSPDGAYAYVSLFDSATGTGGVWVVSLTTMTTRTLILTCDPQNYGEAISQDGKYLLVAGFSMNQVALIDTATSTVDAIIPVGNQPNAIVLSSDNSQAFITNQTDGTVSVVSFAPAL